MLPNCRPEIRHRQDGGIFTGQKPLVVDLLTGPAIHYNGICATEGETGHWRSSIFQKCIWSRIVQAEKSEGSILFSQKSQKTGAKHCGFPAWKRHEVQCFWLYRKHKVY